MEVIKNKEKYFSNVYNVSNTREVTKLMQRSDLMMGWPSKRVTKDKQSTTWWWAGRCANMKRHSKKVKKKTNDKQPDDGLACESLANTRPRIRGTAAVVPSCIIIKFILNNWFSLDIVKYDIGGRIKVQPVAVELSETSAVLDRSPVWLSRTPICKRCHLWCGFRFSEGLRKDKDRDRDEDKDKEQLLTSPVS